MAGNTRKNLRKLARHERDEQAVTYAALSTRRGDLERSAANLIELIAHSEQGLARRLGDALERSMLDNYLTSLRRQLERVVLERDAVIQEQLEAQRQLRRRVVQHRQMDHMVTTSEEVARSEQLRDEERHGDDLASGSWHRLRNGEDC